MLNKFLRCILKFFLFCLLTVVTQIGGVVYLLSELFIKRTSQKYRLKKFFLFILVYSVATFLIVPYTAPLLGRVRIKDTAQIKAHSVFTKLLNRDYVSPKLYTALENVAESFQKSNSGVALVYLDANFPYINGFPLLPHLSHNDGKKIDVSFVYEDQYQEIVNKKPSFSGYGVFETPTKYEYNQNKICKQKGNWQYDFTKYVTLGTVNKDLKFSEKATKDLLLAIIKQKQVNKVFIEPHLKNRFKIQSSKIRFHGCRAVRHDDHIHLQLR
ncbi:hypothetical protein [Aquimarina sediminis]|uniref:hypothetical protein n=1 Tax=Aquimarina sediminis TaxID=2070536 RepID=UPI000CA05722|nr:hypothetical protein [Aquimarina sediminis]